MDIEKYLYIPFGDNVGLGELNCWGLVRKFYKEELNILLPEIMLNSENLQQIVPTIELYQKNDWEICATPTLYSVAAMSHKNRPHHVGIFIGDGLILHTAEGVNTTISDKDNLQDMGFKVLNYWRYKNA